MVKLTSLILILIICSSISECCIYRIDKKISGVVRCHECTADYKVGYCAEDEEVKHTRLTKNHNVCESGWCYKVALGGGRNSTFYQDVWTVGVGQLLRGCMKYPSPGYIERCAFGNYKGAPAFMCFCEGHGCNQATNLDNENIPLLNILLLFVTLKLQ